MFIGCWLKGSELHGNSGHNSLSVKQNWPHICAKQSYDQNKTIQSFNKESRVVFFPQIRLNQTAILKTEAQRDSRVSLVTW